MHPLSTRTHEKKQLKEPFWLAGFKSLFDELYDAGLLAVGALEKGLGLSSEEIKRAASSRNTSTSGAAASGPSSTNQQSSNQSSRYAPGRTVCMSLGHTVCGSPWVGQSTWSANIKVQQCYLAGGD